MLRKKTSMSCDLLNIWFAVTLTGGPCLRAPGVLRQVSIAHFPSTSATRILTSPNCNHCCSKSRGREFRMDTYCGLICMGRYVHVLVGLRFHRTNMYIYKCSIDIHTYLYTYIYIYIYSDSDSETLGGR